MGKIAFIFPGQGSQSVGMGKEIAENYPVAQAIFSEADQVLGRSISGLCFNGPEDNLRDTQNAQPGILTASIAVFQALHTEGIQADFVAGHSLGEYSALIAANSISFADGLKLVNCRAQLMAGADPNQSGTMAAILGLDRQNLMECLKEASKSGVVEAANFNSPGQIVVSGAKSGMAQLQELVTGKGGKMIPLAVSGAFHSSFMKPAAEIFKKELENIKWNNPSMPVIANITAGPVTKENMAESLYRQMFSSVLWEDSLIYLQGQGVNTFVEVGPGKVLSGLVKKTLKGATIVNCEDLSSIKKALAILREV